jgi:hypothetical protein
MISRFNKFVQPDLSWVEHNDIKSYDFSPMANELKKYYTDFANLNAADQLQFKYLTPNQVVGTKVDATADLEAAKAIDSSLKTIKNKAVEAFQKKDWTAYAEATKSLRSVIPQIMQDASALQSRYMSFNEQKDAFQKDSKNLNSKFYWKNLQGSKFKDENGNYGGIGTYSPTAYIDRYKKTQEIFEKLGVKDISYSKVRGEWIDNITQKTVPPEYVKQAEEQLRSNPEYQTQLQIDVLGNFDPNSYKQNINSEKEALKKVIDIAVKDGDKKTIRRIQGMLGVQTDGNFGKNSKEALNNYLAQEPDNLEAHALSKQFQRDIGYGKSLLDNTYSHSLAANPNWEDEEKKLRILKLKKEMEEITNPFPESSDEYKINFNENFKKVSEGEEKAKNQLNSLYRSTYLKKLTEWFGPNTQLKINNGDINKAFAIIAYADNPDKARINIKSSGLNIDPNTVNQMFSFMKSGDVNNTMLEATKSWAELKAQKNNIYNTIGNKITPKLPVKEWSKKTNIPEREIQEAINTGDREKLAKIKYTELRGNSNRGEQQKTYRFIDEYDREVQKIRSSDNPDLNRTFTITTIPLGKHIKSDPTFEADGIDHFSDQQVTGVNSGTKLNVTTLKNKRGAVSADGKNFIITGDYEKPSGGTEKFRGVFDLTGSKNLYSRGKNISNHNKSERNIAFPEGTYLIEDLDRVLNSDNTDKNGYNYSARDVYVDGVKQEFLAKETDWFVGEQNTPIIPLYHKENKGRIGFGMEVEGRLNLLKDK